MASEIKMTKEAEEKYLDLQQSHKHKWIVFGFSDNNKTIELKAVGEKDATFDELRNNIIPTKANYIAYDCKYNLNNGQLREKVLLVLYADEDNCSGTQKMLGTTTFDSVITSCPNYAKVVTINNMDLTEDNFINIVSDNRTK